jgi:hypothetical protein
MRIVALVAVLIGLWATEAMSHEWYTQERSPLPTEQGGGGGCCGGMDCIPLTYEQFYEDGEDFVITLHGFKASVNSKLYSTGRQVYRFPRKLAKPAQGWKPGETGYHACILGGKVICFFYPTGA